MMISKCLVAIGTAALLMVGGSAHSYEVQTHENLTSRAYYRSILANPVSSPLLTFGIEDQGEERFTTRAIYDQVSDEHMEPRRVSAPELIAIAAHQEDVPTQALRFVHHFYDPQHGGRGLEAYGGRPSPAWVLEDLGQIAGQQDSLTDALDFHRLALTMPQQSDRDTYVGRLLETLGRAVHHLQDMSQPAHTRSDGHPPWDHDIYEAYTNTIFGGVGTPIPNVSPYESGPVDLGTFNTARSFWADESGRGIAQFTSLNFVSRDTNFDWQGSAITSNPDYLSPLPAGTHPVTAAELGLYAPSLPSSTPLVFAHTQGYDAYSHETFTNDRASTWSVFTPDLEDFNIHVPKMALNRFNFEKNYHYLFPRAIAYSAGLINYYFRGRLKVEDISSAGGVTTITIRNESAPDFALGVDLPGFRFFYDAANGQRHEIENFQELDDPGAVLEFDATRRFSFTTPADVDLRKQAPYVLMFDGTIGTERGVAAVAFGASNTGFSVVPNYVTNDGVAGARRVAWSNSAWTAVPDAEYLAGSIDWKGHKPEDVLTWGTGSRRYDALSSGGPVYMNGRALTTARGCGVIGASIRYIDGVRVLNVTCSSNGTIRIYSRVLAERYDNEDMWSSDVNPLGWRLVYTGTHGEPFTGFFFNASGTEGQYITRNSITHAPERRVKVTLSGFTGTAVDFPAVATVTQTFRSFLQRDRSINVDAGTCYSPSGVLYGYIVSEPGDGCQRIEYSGTDHSVRGGTTVQEYSDRTLYCVDYRGDEEVFCELQPPSTTLVTSTVHDTAISEELRSVRNTCGDNHSAVQNTQTTTVIVNSVRIMTIGSLDIPWTGEISERVSTRQFGGSFDNPRSYSGTTPGHLTFTNRTSRLIQADARYDFAVYQERRHDAEEESTGGFTEAAGLPSTLDRDTITAERVIMQLGADQRVLFENVDEQSVSNPGTTVPSPSIGLDPCPGLAPYDSSTVTTFVDEATTTDIYSSMSNGSSYAIDRAGRLGLSQHITDFSNPNVSHGYQNILTGSSLPALIPGTPSSQGYRYSIRLVR
jgi:hypothetical protein